MAPIKPILYTADKEQDIYREEARELMRFVQDKCMEYDSERKVSVPAVHVAVPSELTSGAAFHHH